MQLMKTKIESPISQENISKMGVPSPDRAQQPQSYHLPNPVQLIQKREEEKTQIKFATPLLFFLSFSLNSRKKPQYSVVWQKGDRKREKIFPKSRLREI